MQLVTRAKEALNQLLAYWKVPPKGYSVPYKEIAAYGVGGIGVYFAIAIVGAISLSVGNFLIGDTIGIKPQDLQYMNIISTIINFGITAFRAQIFDNTRNKNGKFRPFLKTMGIPTVALSILLVWMPYEKMSYAQKFVTVLVLYELLQIFFPFYRESYDNLARVMSPSSQERMNIISIGSVLWSAAPSLYNFLGPVLAGAFGFKLISLETYRYIYPPFCVIGVFLGYLAYKGTKERIVQAKSHFVHIKFTAALKAVAKNRNFWIISVAGWIGFLEGAAAVILMWQFNYGEIGSAALYGVVNTILGFSALPAMLITPLLSKHMGKKKMLIFINIMNIIFLAALYKTFSVLWTLVVFLFLNKFVSTILDTIFPAINADIRDEQQYITGERIDGVFSVVGLIGSVVGMGTGLVLPQIYKYKGFYGDYSVLFNDELRNSLIEVLIIASVIGAALNVLPYFFYNLTEAKQRGIVKVLKIRAMFEDYGNGVLNDSALVEGVEIIQQAQADVLQAPLIAGRRGSKKLSFEQRIHNEDIENVHYVIDELNKFSSPKMQALIELNSCVYAAGLTGLYDFDKNLLQEAKAMPADTAESMQIKKATLEHYRNLYTACRMIHKYYPEKDIEEPDFTVFETIDTMPESTKKEFRAKKAAMKVAEARQKRFHQSAQPYLEARKMLRQKENYARLDELFSEYDAAKARAEHAEATASDRRRREEAQRKAEAELLRIQRKNRKQK
ncbi:MAG: MFS transporter [Oscillospiraceae bacterium]|jgi:Na+/melibiose symporter-like transporter|nr:MFS transporter [Oscillospiraceae bacterium]